MGNNQSVGVEAKFMQTNSACFESFFLFLSHCLQNFFSKSNHFEGKDGDVGSFVKDQRLLQTSGRLERKDHYDFLSFNKCIQFTLSKLKEKFLSKVVGSHWDGTLKTWNFKILHQGDAERREVSNKIGFNPQWNSFIVSKIILRSKRVASLTSIGSCYFKW